ncbi:VanW family protein [Halalkalibacterium ligniniphilum]|uniref:VanW family protein n=1 Tax=Halalkalibacterium ligniniphilum TaxID=1134413 RepID=UPI000348CA11|nr:VanW family protein [Halalkalibacterium ligniniphilum]
MNVKWLYVGIGMLSFASFHQQDVQAAMLASHHVSVNLNTYVEKAPVIQVVSLIDERTGEEVELNLNEYGYWPGREMNIEGLKEYAASLASTIDTPMQNPKINQAGEITPGKNRVILSEQELVDSIVKLDFDEGQLILPIYETPPTVSENELKGIDEKVIGEYSSSFNPSVLGRSENIALSAKAIQDVVLGPGDRFSFNHVVGERTVERGYKEAKEIVNKQFVMGIGGGICQTSSTLFNAVDEAGLTIIERYTHSREIGYVPAGRDATVSWGGPDFRFENSLEKPIIIRTNIENGRITVTVLTYNG